VDQGQPPGQYLAQWRIHLAGSWLREEHMSLAEAARRLGYRSEAAFSRAFRRHHGRPPGALRREEAPPAGLADVRHRSGRPGMHVLG
jgi:AraC-like DNA-binding protein